MYKKRAFRSSAALNTGNALALAVAGRLIDDDVGNSAFTQQEERHAAVTRPMNQGAGSALGPPLNFS